MAFEKYAAYDFHHIVSFTWAFIFLFLFSETENDLKLTIS